MKKLIILVLLLVPALISAQEHILINRTDGQTGAFIIKEPAVIGDRYTLLIQSPQQAGKSFSILMPDTAINFDPGVTSPLSGAIKNLTDKPVHIIFNRTHLHLPSSDWSSSVCFGQNCYAAFVDSIPPGSAFNLDPANSGTVVMNFNSQDASHVDSIVDYIRFTSLTGDPGDTISFILKGITNSQAAVQDQQPKTITAGPKIMAIYPSPLVQGDMIKVKISSPRESNISYSIYDGIGRAVALGATRQHIGLGDNTIKISSLDGLANGSYMLKLNFSDGSSDSHFFQVMR